MGLAVSVAQEFREGSENSGINVKALLNSLSFNDELLFAANGG